MKRGLGVEILKTETSYIVQLRRGDAAISLRSYKSSEQIDAIRFASEVAQICETEWEIISNPACWC